MLEFTLIDGFVPPHVLAVPPGSSPRIVRRVALVPRDVSSIVDQDIGVVIAMRDGMHYIVQEHYRDIVSLIEKECRT